MTTKNIGAPNSVARYLSAGSFGENKFIVLEGSGHSKHDDTEYKEGNRIVPDRFDPNPLVECSNGIHFFISKLEAEEYD